jgi:hypothetical protein
MGKRSDALLLPGNVVVVGVSRYVRYSRVRGRFITRQENHRDTATADFAAQPLHGPAIVISRRQLIYIKEKNRSFFSESKIEKSEKNWLRKLRSKSTSASASPPAGRFLSVLSVLSGPEHDQQCLAQAPPNVNRP